MHPFINTTVKDCRPFVAITFHLTETLQKRAFLKDVSIHQEDHEDNVIALFYVLH